MKTFVIEYSEKRGCFYYCESEFADKERFDDYMRILEVKSDEDTLHDFIDLLMEEIDEIGEYDLLTIESTATDLARKMNIKYITYDDYQNATF